MLILLSGCDTEDSFDLVEEDEIISCHWCKDEYGYNDRILSKICECYNRNNISYTIDFRCRDSGICDGLTFEDKKKMAMIDDKWYCVCDETAIVMRCKDVEIDDPCRIRAKLYEEEVNRTTEFIWKY